MTGPQACDGVLRQIAGLRAAVPGCTVDIVLLAPNGDALVAYSPPLHDRARADDDSSDWVRVSAPSLLWILADTCSETPH